MSTSSEDSSWGTILIILFIGYFIFGDGCSDDNNIESIFNTVQECHYCSGEGEKDCFWCSGKGEKDCSSCYGEGDKPCNNCNGMGRINEYVGHMYKDGYQLVNYGKLNGYFQVIGGSVNAQCTKCYSSGKVDCDNYSCDDGKIRCNYCYGDGKEKCTYCSGTGER